jgi:copper chaperone CopZ
MTISLGRELLAKHLRILRLPLSSNKDAEERKMAEFTLRIDGMHCGSCVRRVSQALAAVPGAAVNEVRVGAARVTAAEEPAPVDLAIAALAKAGYTAHLES